MKNKNYTGIDLFRFIAALLVIAIHISPLASFNETADFILTRVIARVAVPFFFMTSGFFLLSGHKFKAEKLVTLIKKTAQIYVIAIIVYIPINIYNGYFKMDYLLLNIVKDILFDGTFYHLWYLPASVIGAVIAWFLVKHLDYPKACIIALLLYIIGLFGDSYYGVIHNVSWINACYNFIFYISDYTRNGIFFAPIFFILGGSIADKPQLEFHQCIRGFIFSLMFMLIEALCLHHLNLQRHDSMYILLLPCMYYLFQTLLLYKGKRLVRIRTMSLIIYLIHPLMIVIIRMLAKLLHLQSLLIDNSIINYIMICAASILFSVGVILFYDYLKRKLKVLKNQN